MGCFAFLNCAKSTLLCVFTVSALYAKYTLMAACGWLNVNTTPFLKINKNCT